MSGNPVVEIPTFKGKLVYNYINDTSLPTLDSFNLDMNTGTLTLIFNETVRVSTLDETQITLSELPFTEEGSGSSDVEDIHYYTLKDVSVQDYDFHIVQLNISLDDLNEIKKLRKLATRPNNTHILMSFLIVEDMAGNSFNEIGEGEGKKVAIFIPDTTPPDIDFYHLDMNAGVLHMSFTETVDLETLEIAGRVFFYNSSDFDGLSYSLQDSYSNSTDGPNVYINFTENDLNRLKFIRNLADNVLNTFLYLDGNIKDMVGNVVTEQYMGLNVTRPADMFTIDDTSPRLTSFDFDLDSGVLYLTFSEVVDEILVTEFTFLNGEWNGTEYLELSGYKSVTGPSLLPDGPGHPPHVQIQLSADDLNELKQLLDLAIDENTTYLSITEFAAVDPFGNNIENISTDEPLKVYKWTPDKTEPLLTLFNFSADSGLLVMEFDETVDATSLNVTELTFININTNTSYTLQYPPPHGGTKVSQINSTIIDVIISNYDLNEIKILTDLATAFPNTYLTMTPNTILDMSGNKLNTSNLPLQVHHYDNDKTNPVLMEFDLDMNVGILKLYFTETVNVDTLDITYLTFQSEVSGGTNYTLQSLGEYPNATMTNTTNGSEVVLYLGIRDTNELKRIYSLANSKSNTFITITTDLIVDMVDLHVMPIYSGSAKQVQKYFPDMTEPQFVSFDFDLNTGLLELTFDETIDASTLQGSDMNIIFQSSQSNFKESYTITLGEAIDFDDPVLEFQIEDDDLHAIKKLRGLAVSDSSTYVTLKKGSVYDMAEKANPVLETTRHVTHYGEDKTSPRLTYWVVDVNASLLILNFDEPVDYLLFQPTAITFQNSEIQSSNPYNYYTLTKGYTSSKQGLQIVVHIHNDDLNEIKFREQLLVSQSTSYLSFTGNLISDMKPLPVIAIPTDNATETFDITVDHTRPHLLEFHLDMDASHLHLTFLETINSSSINFTAFTIQTDSKVTSKQNYHRLTGGSLESYVDDTNVTIVITLDDLNKIKALRIASSSDTSWLAIDSYGIQDQNDLYIRPLINGISAMNAFQYTIDTTRPELENFTLDLDTGSLRLYFSETVKASSLNATTITVLNGQGVEGSDNQYIILGKGSVSSNDSHELTVLLEDFDLNQIKKRHLLATNRETTYLSVHSSTVYDMQQNYLVPIEAEYSKQAEIFSPDITEPTLLEFSFDMDTANLTMTFNEPINATSLNTEGITLEGSGGDMVVLTGGLVIDTYDTVIVINVNDYDYDRLKRAGGICSDSDGKCKLILKENSAYDMSGNGNNPMVIDTATEIIRDTTNPYLVYYDLDLDSNQIRLTFSEYLSSPNEDTVKGIKFQASKFELIELNCNDSDNVDPMDPASYCGYLRAYRLTGSFSESGTIFDPGHPPVFTVNLTIDDLNILKSLTSVATSINDTFLLISAGSAIDGINNQLIGTEDDNAVQVRVFTPDKLNPSLDGFTLDMNTGTLVLSFSESVEVSSLEITSVSLQGSKNYTDTSIYRLKNAKTSSCNAPFITLQLSDEDMNEIKKDTLIATSSFTTFISIESTTVNDMNKNPVIAISDTTGKRVSDYEPDTNDPSLIRFTLDMDEGTIVLTFNETVNSLSLFPELLTLTPGISADFSFNITDTGMLLSENSTDISYKLSENDLNELKRLDLCTLRAKGSDCYISFPNDTIEDMNSNPVIPIERETAFQVSEYVNDTTSPKITFFSVDMSYGYVSFNFSETVNVSTFNFTGIILHEFGDTVALYNYRLTGGDRITVNNGLTVDFYLNKDDLEFLRLTDGIFESDTTTYVTLEPGTLSDMSENSLQFTQYYKVTDGEFLSDVVSPEIIGAVFDLDEGSLELTFSETISAVSFKPSDITLVNNESNVTSAFTLRGPTETKNDDGLVISFDLLGNDILEIKKLDALATSIKTTFINHTASLVEDTSKNPAMIRIPFQVTEYIPDIEPPELVSFEVLDLHERFATFQFTEPIDIQSLDVEDFIIQQYRRNIFAVGTSHRLTGYNDLQYDSADTFQKRKITIYLNDKDYKAIVLDTSVGTDGTESGNTFISIAEGGVSDFAGNPLKHVDQDDGEPAITVVDDTTIPQLLSFNLDIDSGLLTMTFDNVMRYQSLDPTAIEIQNQTLASESIEFSGALNSDSDGEDDYVIRINITKADLNAIKKNRAIATNENNTYIVFSADLIDSTGSDPKVGGKDVLAITDAIAKKVTKFTNDTTPPMLESFHVNLNALRGMIHLTFDETVEADSFVITEILLLNQPTNNVSDPNVTLLVLTDRVAPDHPLTVSSADDSTENIISLGFDDANDLKRLTDLYTSESNSYLSFSRDLVIDMNGNEVVEVVIDEARMASAFIADKISPILTDFSLDMDEGFLILTFSETGDTITFDPNGITFKSSDNETEQERFTLTDDSFNITNDDYIVEVMIGFFDLNEIKRYYGLAQSSSTTFISLEPIAVKDMAGNAVESVVAKPVLSFINDTTFAEVVSFHLNMNNGTLQLNFTETVDVETFVFSSITFYSNFNTSVAQSHQLIDGTHVTGDLYYPTIGIVLQDQYTIKLLTDLATSIEDTFIKLQYGTVKDNSLDANPVLAAFLGPENGTYIPDTTPPLLVAFSANLNLSLLTLVFDEPVNTSTINFTAFILIHEQSNTAVPYRLTDGYSDSSNGRKVNLYITDFDLNEIKKRENLFISSESTYLFFEYDAIRDMANNSIEGISSLKAFRSVNFTNDTTRPRLLEFDFDANSGNLTLYFSETVNYMTLNITSITLQSDFIASGLNAYQLTGGKVTKMDDTSLIVTLLKEDLDQLKTYSIGVSNESLWLAIMDGAILDQSDEELVGVYNGTSAIPVEYYIEDVTEPELKSFTLDLNTGVLMLTFSESVNAATFNISSLTIQNSENNSLTDFFTFHTLSSPTQNWKYDIPQQRVYISDQDLNELKRLYLLATEANNTFISIESELIRDVFGNPVVDISIEESLRSISVRPDTNKPQLLSFSLNLTEETLRLTFNETVNATSLDVTAFTLQSDAEALENVTEIFTLTTNSHIIGIDPAGQDSTVITIDIHTFDLNKIKQLTSLATTEMNTFISITSTGIFDMNANSIIEIQDDMARNVSQNFTMTM